VKPTFLPLTRPGGAGINFRIADILTGTSKTPGRG
jgi:hypothetical protein